MRRILLSRSGILLFSALLFLLLTGANGYIRFLQQQHWNDQQKRTVIAQASTLRAEIEREIHTTLNLSMGVIVYVSTHPDLNQAEFAEVAKNLLQSAPHIRNIGLARNNVISHIYPLAGNEAAIGLRYLDHPAQRDAVERAIETRRTVIAGPVDLVQGGRGFIGRIPIYTDAEKEHYWGLASVVIDLKAFYRSTGLDKSRTSARIALRGRDADGMKGSVFFGEHELFEDPGTLMMPIVLPVGSWILAMAPGDAKALPPFADLIQLLSYIGSLVIAFLVYKLLQAMRQNQFLALHDPMTGVANRRLFNEHLEQAIRIGVRGDVRFALLFIDLNGFKAINDMHGHAAGDTVLRAVAERLRSTARAADVIARIGGDEFVVLLNDVDAGDKAQKVADKLTQVIGRPIMLSNETILHIRASIGISLYPENGADSDALMRYADQQMYRQKRRG